jgi:transposase
MAYIETKQRGQYTLFPTTLDELISQDHVCRVMEVFVDRVDMAKLGFVSSELAETGRPGYDPRDLLKLYLHGYLWQIRSSLAAGSRVPAQRGSDVVVRTTAAGPQVDRRVPANAQPGGD